MQAEKQTVYREGRDVTLEELSVKLQETMNRLDDLTLGPKEAGRSVMTKGRNGWIDIKGRKRKNIQNLYFEHP